MSKLTLEQFIDANWVVGVSAVELMDNIDKTFWIVIQKRYLYLDNKLETNSKKITHERGSR